jgi:hypothetical protein
MCFNGIIRSLQVASMGVIMAIGVQLKLKVTQSMYLDPFEFYQAMGLFFILAFSTISVIIFLYKNKHLMNTTRFKSKWENLYQDIHLTRSKSNVYFFPLFIVRRVVFVLIPSVLNFYPWAQIQFAILVQQLYVIFYQNTRPHIMRLRLRLEIFNEMIVMACFYHNFLFTGYCSQNTKGDDENFKFFMGYSYIGIIALCVIVNISSLTSKALDTFQSKKRIKTANLLIKQDKEFLETRLEELTSNQWS